MCPKSVGSAYALKSVGRSNPNPNSTLILSYILKTYLLVFILLYNYINIEFYKTNIISSYLFENKGIKYNSIRLNSILKIITLKGLSKEITINPYKYLIIYIIKNRINLDYNLNNSNLIKDI
jgi:hypothetical protein